MYSMTNTRPLRSKIFGRPAVVSRESLGRTTVRVTSVSVKGFGSSQVVSTVWSLNLLTLCVIIYTKQTLPEEIVTHRVSFSDFTLRVLKIKPLLVTLLLRTNFFILVGTVLKRCPS